jgi:hypothetical protein
MTDLPPAERLAFFALFILSLLIAADIPLRHGVPAGPDAWFHIEVARNWAGESDSHVDWRVVGGSYPPLFHWSILLLHITGLDWVTVMNVLNVLFFPLVMLSTFLLVRKYKGEYAATLSVALMLTSVSVLVISQPYIQAIDMFLFPVVIWALLENKRKSFLLSAIYMSYSHGGYALCLLAGLFLYSFLYKRDRNTMRLWAFLGVLLIPLAVFLLSNTGLLHKALTQGPLGMDSGLETAMLENPHLLLWFMGPAIPILAIPSLFSFSRKKHRDTFDRVLVLWLVSLLPVAVFFVDRFAIYLAQPMAVLVAISLHENVKEFRKPLLFLLLAMAFIVSGLYIFHLKIMEAFIGVARSPAEVGYMASVIFEGEITCLR